MLFQPLTPQEAYTELTFHLMRLAHERYYRIYKWQIQQAREQHPFNEKLAEDLMDTLKYEVRQTEVHYASAGGVCDHFYISNKDGDYICERCHKFSILHKFIARIPHHD